VPLQTSYAMMFCGDSSWCCCFDNFGKSCDTTQCCTRNFTLTRGIGTVVRQFDDTGSSNTIDDDNPRGGPNGNGSFDWRGRGLIPVVVAAVVGSLLLATVVAFGFTWSQNRRLKRQVENLQEISTKTLSFSTTSARPSVSVQPSTAASYPLSYPPEPYPEELLSPNESYHNIVRTLSANRPQNYSTYQPQPPTPSSATQGPGFGYFQGQPAAPAPRRPSWSSRNVRHADSTASFSEFMGRQGISELPAEKEPRHF
jgi:type II secretory pathway pseudopilin PulG